MARRECRARKNAYWGDGWLSRSVLCEAFCWKGSNKVLRAETLRLLSHGEVKLGLIYLFLWLRRDAEDYVSSVRVEEVP
jgi:hypothetical protein